MKVYIDTNVYLDYLLERKNSLHAFIIFARALKCEFHIIVSDLVLRELNNVMDVKDSAMLFKILTPKIILVETRFADKMLAQSLQTHYSDALHIALAMKSNADVIITNNIKDFHLIFKTKRPEEF